MLQRLRRNHRKCIYISIRSKINYAQSSKSSNVLVEKIISRNLSGYKILENATEFSNSKVCGTQILGENIEKMEKLFAYPGIANSDDIVHCLRTIDCLKLSLPLTYCMDAISIFSFRHDSPRIELILRLFMENVSKVNNISFKSGGSRSNSKRKASDTLISFAINSLMKYGHCNNALTLWMLMNNYNYITSKRTLELLLDYLGSSQKTQHMELIDKIHNIAKSNLWNQSPAYYNRIMAAIQPQLRFICDELALTNAHDRVQSVWSGYVDLLRSNVTSINELSYASLIDMHSKRVHSLATITQIARNLGLQHNQYKEHAKLAFNDMIQTVISIEGSSRLSHKEGKNVIQNETISFLLRSIKEIKNDVVKGLKSEVFVSSIDYSHHSNDSHHHLIKLTNIPIEYSIRTFLLEKSINALLIQLTIDNQLDDLLQFIDQFVNVLSKTVELPLFIDSKISLSNKPQVKSGFGETNNLLQPREWNKLSILKKYQNNIFPYKDFHRERTWTTNIFSTLVQSLMRELSSSSVEDRAIKISVLVSRLLNFAKLNKIRLGEKFYASWIQSFGIYSDAGLSSHTSNYHRALDAANYVIASLDDEVKDSPLVLDALIQVVCSHYDTVALDKAVEILYGKIGEGVPILPNTWCVILNAATICLNDESLRKLMTRLNDLKNSSRLENCQNILRSQIYAYARINNGYEALNLLRKYREIGGKCDIQMYSRVISALYLGLPDSEQWWKIVKDPKHTVEWILREMLRDGHHANSDVVALLLKLYTKNCQIAKVHGSSNIPFNEAKLFLEKFASSGYMNHPKVKITEKTIKELIKCCCVSGLEEMAHQILITCEAKYGIKSTSLSYEPIIYYYCVIEPNLAIVEDIMITMVNRGVQLSTPIVDAIISANLLTGNSVDVLDRIQEIYTEHKVRPSPGALLRLLDFLLNRNDQHEARRVLVIIDQLFTEKERQESNYIPLNKLEADIMPTTLRKNHDSWINTKSPLLHQRGVLTRENLAIRFKTNKII